jgi:hypothetical protein
MATAAKTGPLGFERWELFAAMTVEFIRRKRGECAYLVDHMVCCGKASIGSSFPYWRLPTLLVLLELKSGKLRESDTDTRPCW